MQAKILSDIVSQDIIRRKLDYYENSTKTVFYTDFVFDGFTFMSRQCFDLKKRVTMQK